MSSARHKPKPAPQPAMGSLHIFSPSGVVTTPSLLKRAAQRLEQWGFSVEVDEAASAKSQRFAGDDGTRLQAIHRVARAAPSVALASRGGYGLSRLLDALDWKLLCRSVERGTRWVGYSDITALHLGLMAHAGASSWAGPHALEDFGRPDTPELVDDITRDVFLEAMQGVLEGVGFKTPAGYDGLEVRGTLWGGNLRMVTSLLGTAHFPTVKSGILFLEDVGEHPYRIERMLLQLLQAGVIDRQKAVVLGHFTDWRASPLDRGYGLKSVWELMRSRTRVPILQGLPFGHVPTRVSLPVGRRTRLLVDGTQAWLNWA